MSEERKLEAGFPVRVTMMTHLAKGSGKGTVVCLNLSELVTALTEIIVNEKFGRAGDIVMIERFEKPPSTADWE